MRQFAHVVTLLAIARSTVFLAALTVLLPFTCLSSAAGEPLVVDENSHVVVMEYEAWFGPNAVTFQGSAALPLLQSADMQAVGGGYDSADPAVIRGHVRSLEYLGVDAALVDLTNDVSCIFNSEWFVKKYLQNFNSCPALRADYQNIRHNTGNLYPAWARLDTPLKIIRLLGGIDQNVLIPDLDGKTAFEKEIEYFSIRMERYPDRNVVYQGKPLLVVYLGAAQDPTISDNPLWFQLRTFLRAHPEITRKYTFKMMAGYLDSQPALWENPGVASGPEEVNPTYGFWSWVDRLKSECTVAPYCPYFPSYNRSGSRAENFTASIATAGQNGWGCPNNNAPPYCPDASLRYAWKHSYTTFDAFMDYAAQLDPIFLFIHQFNEFVPADEGWNADTDDDIEPANLWSDDYAIIKGRIEKYRRETGSTN